VKNILPRIVSVLLAACLLVDPTRAVARPQQQSFAGYPSIVAEQNRFSEDAVTPFLLSPLHETLSNSHHFFSHVLKISGLYGIQKNGYWFSWRQVFKWWRQGRVSLGRLHWHAAIAGANVGPQEEPSQSGESPNSELAHIIDLMKMYQRHPSAKRLQQLKTEVQVFVKERKTFELFLRKALPTYADIVNAELRHILRDTRDLELLVLSMESGGWLAHWASHSLLTKLLFDTFKKERPYIQEAQTYKDRLGSFVDRISHPPVLFRVAGILTLLGDTTLAMPLLEEYLRRWANGKTQGSYFVEFLGDDLILLVLQQMRPAGILDALANLAVEPFPLTVKKGTEEYGRVVRVHFNVIKTIGLILQDHPEEESRVLKRYRQRIGSVSTLANFRAWRARANIGEIIEMRDFTANDFAEAILELADDERENAVVASMFGSERVLFIVQGDKDSVPILPLLTDHFVMLHDHPTGHAPTPSLLSERDRQTTKEYGELHPTMLCLQKNPKTQDLLLAFWDRTVGPVAGLNPGVWPVKGVQVVKMNPRSLGSAFTALLPVPRALPPGQPDRGPKATTPTLALRAA